MSLDLRAGRVYVAAGIIILTASGCDLIEDIKGRLTGSKKPVVAAPASTPAPKPVEQKPKPVHMGPDTLARVGNWTMTVPQFEERLKAVQEILPEFDAADPESRRFVLDELVRQQLIVADAEKSGLAAQKDIRDAVEEFRRTLIVREKVADLTENIDVTEEDALEFYEEQKDALREPPKWHVREIVVNDKAAADQVLVRILEGEDFAAVAQEVSAGETASDGGDLGYITEAPFPQMVNALLPLEEGGVSGVFKGPNGYYIVKLEEKTTGQQIPFEDVRDQIVENLKLLKQQQAVLDYLEGLEKNIPVEIKEDLLTVE